MAGLTASEASSETWGNRVGKIATTMAAVLYNFTKWSFEIGSGRGIFIITVDEATAFPDVARYTAQGYIEYTSRVVSGGNERVTSERPLPSRVLFKGQRTKCVTERGPPRASRKRARSGREGEQLNQAGGSRSSGRARMSWNTRAPAAASAPASVCAA
jgi:hypothetical protein